MGEYSLSQPVRQNSVPSRGTRYIEGIGTR